MQIRKAVRRKAKLRLGLVAPSGGGKTYSALQIALGLGGKIGLVDTEHGSGDLYAHLGDYDIINITAPYTVKKYRDAIKSFEDEGYTTIIIDSLSHAWAGEGGLLEKQGKIEDSSRSKNGYAAWRMITPDHNNLIDAMLQSKSHIIATMRTKTEYIVETNSNGKEVPRKIGLAPIQRDGMDYEFTVVLEIDEKHNATSSKDRTGMFDGELFKPSIETGKKLLQWLELGEDPLPIKNIIDNRLSINDIIVSIGKSNDMTSLTESISVINSMSLSDEETDMLRSIYKDKRSQLTS